MTVAEDLIRSGDIAGARKALQDEVRKAPSRADLRVFLFQLLCVCGDWERALTQLRLCGELDPATHPMVQTYREAIGCEMVRERVFAGEMQPHIFGDPSEWIALMIEATRRLAAGDTGGAALLREKAFDAASASSGSMDGADFAWIADADMRLGPIFEAVVNGRYFWVPVDAVASITAEAPADLRDAVWLPVEITWANGGQVPALMPTRYPGSGSHADDGVRLSRKTVWEDRGEGTWVGYGQRLLATDGGDHALMDLRKLSVGSGGGIAADG